VADRNAWVDALLGLRDFVGDPPRWGGTIDLPTNAADPSNLLIGDPIKVMASVSLPAPVPLTIRWGYWKPAPFAIPGLTLPVGGGGFFRPDTSTGGVRHHDAYRMRMEWGIPGANGIQMQQWIGPNTQVTIGAQNLTLRLFRIRKTTLDMQAKCFVTLGDIGNPVLNEKCTQSTKTVVAGIAASPNWTQVVGSNWARRGGFVTSTLLAEDAWVSFNEFNPTPAAVEGWRLIAATAPTVAIPVDWCGPVWATTDGGADITVVEHWVSGPEMEPWAETP